MLISIIIPVFNTEKYLHKCISSVINQSYKELEIIIVNDGSTDTSDKIINDFLKIKHSIKYISKDNGGLSSARNTGLLASSGDYIIFLDSDDWLGENHVKNFIDHMQGLSYNPDLVLSSYRLIDSKLNKIYCPEVLPPNEILNNIYFDNNNLSKSLLSGFNYPGFFDKSFSLMPVWKNLYKRDLIFSNSVFFYSEREIYLEDYDFNLRYFQHVNSFSVCKNFEYYHLTVPNSLSKSFKLNLSKLYIALYKRIYSIINDSKSLHSDFLFNFIAIKSVNIANNYSFKSFSLFKNYIKDYLNNSLVKNTFFFDGKFYFPSANYKYIFYLLKYKRFFLVYLIFRFFHIFNLLYRYYLYSLSIKNYAIYSDIKH